MDYPISNSATGHALCALAYREGHLCEQAAHGFGRLMRRILGEVMVARDGMKAIIDDDVGSR